MNPDLLQIVQAFGDRRVLVVGDFMLDRYIIGDADRISPEAPVPVLRATEDEDRVGGAGSVALNALALGARAICIGMLGADAHGDRVLGMLESAGADVSGLIRVDDRPTITKTRIVGLAEHRHRQQILRVDREVVRPPSNADAGRLLAAVESSLAEADVVCLEDYAKGLLTPEICAAVIGKARERGKPVLVDPARVRQWEKYRGATLLTPNRAELEICAGGALADHEIEAAALSALRQHDLVALVVTLGRDGARLFKREGGSQRFATRPRAVYDNTGAGDAVLAMIAVALAAGATFEQAVPLANIAGGLEVQRFGCVPITRDEVLAELRAAQEATRSKLRNMEELLGELTARRERGETVVFTNGCFDLLHPGHVELLDHARSLGSVLVVGLNSDDSIRRQNKGADRPVRDQVARARMLGALQSVDYVILFDEASVAPLIQRIRPDVLVKGGDYAPAAVVGREAMESWGGKVVVAPFVEGYSTTHELERIRGRG